MSNERIDQARKAFWTAFIRNRGRMRHDDAITLEKDAGYHDGRAISAHLRSHYLELAGADLVFTQKSWDALAEDWAEHRSELLTRS